MALSPEQHAALESLLCGSSYKQAAADAGIGQSTLWTWRTQPQHREFQIALAHRRREQRNLTALRFELTLTAALKAAVADCESPDPAVRHRAWSKLLEHSLALRGLEIQGKLAGETEGDHGPERPPALPPGEPPSPPSPELLS